MSRTQHHMAILLPLLFSVIGCHAFDEVLPYQEIPQVQDASFINMGGDLGEEKDSSYFQKIEAEDAMLRGRFREQTDPNASGGSWVELKSIDMVSSIEHTFTGPAGSYNIILCYFDENDGKNSMTLLLGDQEIETWQWDRELGNRIASPSTRTSYLFESLKLDPMVLIRFEGVVKDLDEPLRTDFFVICDNCQEKDVACSL